MRRKLVDIITMGCSKNLVDSERLMWMFSERGYKVRHNPEVIDGEIVVVNTCGFIGDAKEESINMILSCCEAKSSGQISRLYVMGCLSERYFKELNKEIPQVDKFYGKFNWQSLLTDLGQPSVNNETYGRCLTTPRHYAYLKISEGCDRRCAYCAIPIITGHHRSRSMDDILSEAQHLVDNGVKEIQLIAQELTYYGKDLYHEGKITELVERLSDIKGLKWLRLHYAYPTDFPTDLLRVMRERPNVCKYLDIALQHISDNVLSNMRRHVTKVETYELINRIRKEVPGIHLRTTLMVGFPGEGEKEFNELKEFVRDMRFERMGAFAYSEEEGTYAARHFKDDIPEDVKEKRLSELMAIQQEISTELNSSKVGQCFKVIIDRREGDYYIGRTEYDSPDVDDEVLIPVIDGQLRRGCFYDIEITGAEEFDLFGKRIHR